MAEFEPLGVAARASELLHSLGIKQPTPVQAQTIPVALTGKDVISQAQTGTGKTLAFVLPMLERIKPEVPYLQGLIVTPTRELAIQITAEIKKLLPAYEGVRVLAVYGGQDVEAQLHKLEGNMHMIVATPGRLLDHMRRETVRLSNVRMMVLDEADQMLHMGFLGEVEEIMSKTPKDRQTMLFSATMPDKIRNLAGRYLRDPQEVTVKAKQVTVKDTAQLVIETTDRAKQAALVAMIEETQPYLGMVFCRTKRRASTLNEALQALGYSSDELHGDLSQAKREQVMRKFREAKLQILVATDIAARGLDVEGVTHVYNYDVPQDAESYIHRIGRTGRAGESGMAITFVAPKDRGDLGVIEDGIGMFIERRKIGAAGGSVAAEGAPTAKTRTPGAFGKRAGAAGAGARGGATRGGGRRGESRADDRGARGEGRGAVRGGVVRGARGDSAAALGGRGAERGLRGGAANAGAGRGKGVPTRGERGAGAGGGAGEERAAKWWEQGEYFAPAPEERAAEPQAQRRRPGAGGPGNGRREAGAGRPQAAPGRGPRSGGSAAGEGRYAGAAALGGRAERGAKAYGAPAERPKRGGDRAASAGRGERSFGAGPGGGAGGFARGSERPSGGRSGGRPQSGGRKPSSGGRGGFGGAPGGGAGRGKAPSRSPKGRK